MKVDGPHLGGGALGDLEHHVDAVGVEVDDLGIDPGTIEALAPVDVEDALDVRLHPRAGIDGARLELHLRDERLVFDLPIAFKGNAAHDRVLDDDDDNSAAVAADADILEQAGGEQDLQRFVDLGGIVTVAGRKGEVSADRLRLDALVAFDTNGLDRGALSVRGKLAELRSHPARAGRYSTQGGLQAALWSTSCAPLLVSSPQSRSPPPLRLPRLKLAAFCGRFWVLAPSRQREPFGPRAAFGL